MHNFILHPECKIGLIPDVGGTWWIPRLKLYSQWQNKSMVGGVGNYLALTGARLNAEDLIYAGIATHYVKSNKLEELKRALIDTSEGDDSSKLGDCAASVLTSFHDDSIDLEQGSFLSQNRQDIDYAFDGKDSMEEIFTSLESMDDSKFGQSTLKTLKQMSPTSLKVTLEGMKRGAKVQTIGEALQMEYRITQALMKEGSDFYEGIRAVLVDKDGNPKWSPASLQEVTEEIVDSHFEELGDRELCLVGKKSAKL